MKKYHLLNLSLIFTFFSAHAQISNGNGGTILPNSPTTNTNVGIGTNTPNSRLEITGFSNGQTFTDFMDAFRKSSILNIGALREGSSDKINRTLTFFDLPDSNVAKAQTWFGITDRNDATRFRHYAVNNGMSYFMLFDKTQKEFFKVAETEGDGIVYLQLGKPNSKLTVGGYSNDSNSDGYKFFVKAGNARVEGNIITDASLGIGTTSPKGKFEIIGENEGNTYADAKDLSSKELLLNVGSKVNSSDPASEGNRLLTFVDRPKCNLYPLSATFLNIEDRKDNNRFRHYAQTDGMSFLRLADKTEKEYFKVGETDGDGIVYLQLGKLNSKLTVGGYSNDPNSDGYKFFVKAGNAKVEGNIVSDANIGIGTANFVDGNDTYRLSVKGKVRAQEVKVYNTWADYVFAKNYSLMPLNEVEKYINTNGHLPNVPSAKEITEKGLELGEMSKIQQEKIEELTLYIIQQNKEIEELKALVKTLVEKNKE